ncbi:glycosyltransferase involved in cell wall biosynthesis [Rhodoligotrophos appendicifer]|uniref:glycosyltransferase n=1 Tax=Rhodoligotrophos appendicifer TaxID=987056 RepID=UPI0011854E5D|nr:glycosyltransferase [Rhodoligotrophos appendicifer]
MKKHTPVVILSTADFDSRIWTNKQHIAVRLSKICDVYYIESLGLRTPKVNFEDVRRVAGRFFAAIPGHRTQSSNKDKIHNLVVISPFVLPWHNSTTIRSINRLLIRILMKRKLPDRYILWTFSPLTYDLEQSAVSVIYHSVDLLHKLPGIPKTVLLNQERRLISRADAVIASSKGVKDHIKTQGGEALLWENVADIELFSSHQSYERERRAIFVGNLTQSKVDFAILENLIRLNVRIALAGPCSIDGTQRDPLLNRILQSKNVTYLGVLTQKEMAVELGRSWVGIIPYHINDYTNGVFPMKIYEYLASGLPVIATKLRSLNSLAIDGLDLVSSDEFASRVLHLCESERRAPAGIYDNNSWEARLAQIQDLLRRIGGAG